MKTTLIAGAFFVLGIGAGIFLVCGLILDGPEKVLEGSTRSYLEMNVVYATLLHEGEGAQLQRLLERQMSASLIYQDKLHFADEHHS